MTVWPIVKLLKASVSPRITSKMPLDLKKTFDLAIFCKVGSIAVRIAIVDLDGLYCIRATALGAINGRYKMSMHRQLALNSNAEKWAQIVASSEQAGISMIASARP